MPFDNLLAVIVLNCGNALADSTLRDVHTRRGLLHRTGLRELHESFEVLNQLTLRLLNLVRKVDGVDVQKLNHAACFLREEVLASLAITDLMVGVLRRLR